VFGTGGIPGRDHSFDPLESFGTGRINIEDLGMGMGTAQNTANKHPGQIDIPRIDSSPRNFCRPVFARDPLSDIR